MEIIINNQKKQLPELETISVQDLLHLEIPGKQMGVAVAINNQVVAKSQWANTSVSDKDTIMIIRATQGG
ncbi:MAG TPA: sulfur carrier protein ThiS [Bacteroidia bacterium]|nr:sulfur carrier protein ThiS [Bacteroidia bacterium]